MIYAARTARCSLWREKLSRDVKGRDSEEMRKDGSERQGIGRGGGRQESTMGAQRILSEKGQETREKRPC
eukprot:1313256-Rhodomonas_salina.1